MCELEDAKTVAVKACVSCSGGLLECDKFCLWCGVRQLNSMTMTSHQSGGIELTSVDSNGLSPYTTSRLAQAGSEVDLYRRVSGPLVSAVIASVSVNSSQSHSRFAKRTILGLISIPIWLIIVLLSPLDAYVAAKNLLRET